MTRTASVAFLLLAPSLAQEPPPATPPAARVEYLWQGRAPLATGDADADRPSLTLFPAPGTDPHPAIVVCPGGAYGFLARDHEGTTVAAFLQQLGISAFVLTYRIAPAYHHPCPMLDVQRAIRTVRARATEWHVDPARIGVMGFSAGGHLASTAVTHFDAGKADADDPVERSSCRPDFGVLVYPVIALDKPYTHQGSKQNLLGPRADDRELIDDLSTSHRVTEKTPPCFLVHTSGDTLVPPENSVEFYLALRACRVPAELHVYERGGHGFGLATKDPVLSNWTDRLRTWLVVRGVLPG